MKTPITAILLSTLLLQTGALAATQDMRMQEHMQEMESLMAAIKAEQDPARLEVLMQQHLELMQAGVEMMSTDTTSTSGMTMENRMQGMEHKMEMMQNMMGQMMEHENEERARPVHQHKR